MHFLTVLGHTLQTKNKLELAVLRYLQDEVNRKLIKDYDVPDFKKQVRNKVEALQNEHPRCKPVMLDWYQPNSGKNDDWVLHTSFLQFTMYAEKKVVTLGGTQL
jgi:hypothetical protein